MHAYCWSTSKNHCKRKNIDSIAVVKLQLREVVWVLKCQTGPYHSLLNFFDV